MIFVRLALALVSSFVLFTLVSFLHGMFGGPKMHSETKSAQHAVVAELFKKPEAERKAPQRMRSIQSSSSEGKSERAPMTMRFSPDLSVDAGSMGEAGAGVALQTQELTAEVFDEGQTDEDAVPQYNPPVPYPDRAREQGLQGTLEVVVVVNHLGRVASVEVVKSPSPLIANEARRVISTWRFKPAQNKGVPVSVRMKQSIDFKLE